MEKRSTDSEKKNLKKKPRIRRRKDGQIRYDLIKEPNRVGRPSKWKTEFSEIVYHARALGRNDSEIIERLKVNADTFYRWLREKSDFSDAYHKGKFELETIANQALFHKIKGQKLKRTEKKEYVDKFGEKQTLYSEVIQETAPDVLALNNFLNRRISAFKLDPLEDPNVSKVDLLLGALAQIAPEKMQKALDKHTVIDATPDSPLTDNPPYPSKE